MLAVGFSIWAFVDFSETKSGLDLLWGALGLLSGVGLIYYGRFVLNKLKDFPYL